MLNSREHGPGPKLLDRSEHTQRSFFTTEITKEKLRKSSGTGDPFFCYVHYNDPHHPYRPPLLYLDEYTDETSATPEEALSFAEEMGDNLYEYMSEGVPFTDEEWEMLYAMYDAVIRYVDDCVGDLFDFVRKNFEDTIVVITSDHGDLFGEKNLLGHHIVLHDALIHVPLVVHGLKDVQRCASQPTQHIDVMQTLLSVTGADVSQFQGYNLMEECREIAVSQDHRGTVDDDEAQNYERIRQYNPDVDLSYLPKSRVASFRTTEFKLVQTDEWERLYRLPDESEDVTEKHPSVYEELSSFAHEWWENEGKPFDVEPSKKELEEETKQQLRDMGYLE